jgi:hydrogenase maturation protease
VKIAVIGVGQELRGDDGAGPQAVRHWRQTYPNSSNSRHVRVGFVAEPGLSLLDALEGADAGIVVDAVSSGGAPGTVHNLSCAALRPAQSASGGMHGWSIEQALALGELMQQLPPRGRIRLIGLEVGQTDFGAPLSPAVQAAIPAACQQIESLFHELRLS